MNSLDYLSRDEVLKTIDKRIRDLDNSIHSRVKNAKLQLMALRKEITEMDSIGWKGHEEAKSSVADLLAMQKTIGDDYSEICGKAATEITDLAIQVRIAEDSIERIFRNYRNLLEEIDKLQKYKLFADEDDAEILIRLKDVKKILGGEEDDG